MAFRLVYTEFWNDSKVMEEMTPEDKYFYLYLLTNPCTNMIGIYKIVKKQMAFDLGYSIESVNSLMDRFIKCHELIIYNEQTKEICIKNYGKYNLNRGGKPMLDCIRKDLSTVIDKNLISQMVVHVKNPAIKKFIEEYMYKFKNSAARDNNFVNSSEKNMDLNSDTHNDMYNGTGDDTYNDTQNSNVDDTCNVTTSDTCNDMYNSTNNANSDDTCNDSSTIRGQNHNPKTINHNPKTIILKPKTTNHKPCNVSESAVVDLNNMAVFKHFEKCGFLMTAKLMEFISADISVFSADWLMEAADIAMKRGKINNYSYVLGILQNWQTKGKEQTDGGRRSNSEQNNECKSEIYDFSKGNSDRKWDEVEDTGEY
ncbi:hypothetical protein [Clostridium sp. HBUAS56017]|uniref:hypothetical protein n=1 Tax=Clostridium sp. HBUAS56017 TaxID=2571128 RepID=UPI001178504E|nr:hypothetical protein [Clostridium sp. HBUAS56017]